MVPPVQSVSAAGRGRAPAATTWPALAPGPVWGIAILCALSGALAPAPWWQLGIVGAALAVCALAGRIGAPALRLGLWGAVLFVALRVAYRVIFTSTVAPPADALLLLDLPVIPLSGPFRGISLLGPLTLAQLLATLAEASRFAAVFVVFGAANALADVRTVLARAPRPLLPVATVLALALGTVPALLLAADRVSRAARMRGERRGARLLVPVLEQAVERATTLGASMELRGFGSKLPGYRGDSPTSPPAVAGASGTGRVLLRAEGIAVRHRAGETLRTTLEDADLELSAGELTILTGPTGSGKSTLLAALAGLAPAYTGGEASGTLEVAGRVVADRRPANLAGTVALVPQRVEHSFVAETVRGELAFALVHQGIAGDALAAAVERELERFDLVRLADRDPATLSAGEATRTALAAACLLEPRILLLDEPIEDLDPASTSAVIAALRARLAAGCAVLVAEHRPEALEALASEVAVQRLEMREGSLQPGPAGGDGAVSGASDGVRAPASTCSATAPSGPSIAAGPDRAEGHRIVLLVDHVVERGGRELLRVPELSASPGEIVVLGGPNGSGKTSLLEDIALPGSSGRAPGIALVPHRVDDLLIRDTLADECRYADRRSGAERGATAARFARLIAGSIPGIASRPEPVSERDTDLSGAESAPSLGVLATTHPRDLSAGTRLVLGIAVQLASAPRTLLLDEPTRGLDAAACERLAGILVELTAADAAEGTAVVIATHDTDFADRLAAAGARTRRLRLIDGRLS